MYFTLVVVDGSRTIALEENCSPNPRTNPNPGAIFVTVPHYVSYMEPVLELYKGLLGDWQVCSVE